MRALFALLLTVLCAAVCNAVPIVFEHKGVGTGELDGKPFRNTPFTITAYGDTNDRVGNGSPYSINHTFAQIELSGIGTFQYTIATRTYVLQSYPIDNFTSLVGFTRVAPFEHDLLNGPVLQKYAHWDMLSSVGPDSSGGVLFSGGGVTTTTGGLLQFSDTQLVPVTFTATILPEPSSLVLISVVGLLLSARRPRRA